MSEILLVKNLSGSFNDQHIGHEVINSYCADDNNVYFYIPPYGSIGSEKKDFFKQSIYKNIKFIFVFDDVNITNVLKLKQIILDPIKFDSFDKMKEQVEKTTYASKPLIDIDFGDQNFLENNDKDFICDLKDECMKVYLLSYKIDKEKVFDFSNDNIFIYVKSSEKRNILKEKSMQTFRLVFGQDAKIYDDVDIVVGQKQYAYKDLSNLKDWFDKNIKNLCTNERKMLFNAVPTNFKSNYLYDDNNFLSFVRKTNDENYYSNYLNGILNSNNELLRAFFSYLIKKIHNLDSYTSTNTKCLIQTQSMTKDMKLINKLINYRIEHTKLETLTHCEKVIKLLKRKYDYTDNEIDGYISEVNSKEKLNKLMFVDGQIDLFLYDDKYRIVIENKILSGLNGKHKEISEDINQLITYDKYLNHLNRTKNKKNKVIILCPYCLSSNFVNYKIGKDSVINITYRDLANFFSANINLIPDTYRDDFIKTINRQALTKEELITYRFIKTINS